MRTNPTLKISTMTFVARIENTVDLPSIYEKGIRESSFLQQVDFFIEDKSKKMTKKGKPKKSFGNQMTIKSRTMKFNLKVFFNGKIQVTGVKSRDNLELIFDKLDRLYGIKVTSPKLVMKNSVVNLEVDLNLYALFQRMVHMKLSANYTPEIYPGLKLKHDNSTALIFATGKVILSSKSDDDPLELLDLVKDAVRTSHDFQNEPCGSIAQIATA